MTAMTTRKQAGRPAKAVPPDAAEIVKAMAADGFSVVGIAAKLGVSDNLLRRWFDEYPALKEAFDLGREMERQALHNMLYRDAMEKGNATAAMFLLKSRHGYREGADVEQPNRVSITFNLPGAMTMDEFTKGVTIENGK